MIVRRYTRVDIPTMVKHLKDGLGGFHYSSVYFDEQKVVNLLTGNVSNSAWFCDVVVENDEVVGALAASICHFMFSSEVYAQDHITYILPQHRNLKAITSLVRNYVKWAEERGARQVRWSQSSGFKMEKFPLLAKRLGFHQIGTHFNMEIGK